MRAGAFPFCIVLAGLLLATCATPTYTHDVGIDAILLPERNYSVQGDSVPICVRLHNYGASPERDITVRAEVYASESVLVYTAQGTVDSLGLRPDTLSCGFPAWTATAGEAFGEFRLEVSSELNGDQYDGDDERARTYYVVFGNDMAATSIVTQAPMGLRSFTPLAVFQNRGARDETNVTVTFKAIYGGQAVFTSQKQIASLGPLVSVQVEFDPWFVVEPLVGHVVTLRVETQGGDDNPADDALEVDVVVLSPPPEPSPAVWTGEP